MQYLVPLIYPFRAVFDITRYVITCDFEKRGTESLCRYLYTTIKKDILDGTLGADEKLPSKRSLATHLGVSVITISNAYAQLISEGYLYSIEKKGFFVTGVEYPPSQETVCAAAIVAPETAPAYYADFGSNATSSEKFPFSLWSKMLRTVLHSPHDNLLKSAPAQGVLELRTAIASYLRRFRNMTVAPDQIVIGAGTEYMYGMIAALIGRDVLYAVENPGYRKAASVLRMNGVHCCPLPLDCDGIIPSALEQSGAAVVHVSPSHHFPTGIVMPVRRRCELLAWASGGDERYIIEDDYDSEFRFNGKPIETLQSASGGGCVIYVNTFSKTLAPSYRISYMVLPSAMLPLFYQRFGFCACPVSLFEQYALSQFMQNGYYEKHIIRMKNYYRSLRNNLITAIATSPLAHMVQIHEEDAGLHFLLSVAPDVDVRRVSYNLEKLSVRIPLLSEYFYPSEDCQPQFLQKISADAADHVFVINYSGIKKERISEAVRRIVQAFTMDA